MGRTHTPGPQKHLRIVIEHLLARSEVHESLENLQIERRGYRLEDDTQTRPLSARPLDRLGDRLETVDSKNETQPSGMRLLKNLNINKTPDFKECTSYQSFFFCNPKVKT
jgi:hypothetical protein